MKKKILLLFTSLLLFCSCGSNTASDKVEQLSKLQELPDKGTITQSEFDKMKSEIMAENEESDEGKGPGTSGLNNGHEYVDLGLPSGTKWATYNVGATKPTEYGDYFAWGETKPKEDYRWGTYKWCKGSDYSMTKYCNKSKYGTVDNKTVLDAEDDAVTANWGSAWRMPTTEEQRELIEGCDWEWVEDFSGSGVNGQLGTSKNGATIFLPAAGYRDGVVEVRIGNYGSYWSSSLYDYYSSGAYFLYFNDGDIDWYLSYRSGGRSVRAVLR